MKKILAASLLAADFANLGRDIEMVNDSQCDWFHLDIMDGLFVPNISYGFPVVKSIAAKAKKPLDAHLMIMDPDRYIGRFAEFGVEYLSVHYEACTHLHRTLQLIRSYGMKAGVALNPHTPVSCLEEVVCECDFVLIMSVNPGFGGQKFIENAVDKVRRTKALIEAKGADCFIEIDGGVNAGNIDFLAEAGVSAFVAGNAIFSQADPVEMIAKMKQ